MTARDRIPATLESYFAQLPELSLVLLTGTIRCSPSWLAARLAGVSLNPTWGSERSPTALVIASWTRDLSFWQDEIRRTTGIDTAKHARSQRFTFVDLLSHPSAQSGRSLALDDESTIHAAISGLAEHGRRNVQLILDGPDIALAMGNTSAPQLGAAVLRLRSRAHSTVVACGADASFLANAALVSSATPVEAEMAAFVVQLTHSALMTMSVRELETGSARDVSGVLSMTRGGCIYDLNWGAQGKEGLECMEALYLVNRDASVRVFKRGTTD